jgi:DNA-binding Lrp family transcriptional regulator
VDELDRKIIGCLLRDGRGTYAEIGEQVSLSAPAVKRRVDRLVASGSIRGFTAVIDPVALGWEVEAYVEIYCKGNVGPDELRRSFEHVPEVISACTVSGSADAMVHMLAENIHQLERAMERLREERNVDHTESVIVLSRLIDHPRW